MSFKLTAKLSGGLEIDGSIAKVVGLRMPVGHVKGEISVGFFLDNERKAENDPFSVVDFPVKEEGVCFFSTEELSKNGRNPIKSAYEYLKTQPGFEDAEDC